MTWESKVFFKVLLIKYHNGELDIQEIERELIKKMGKENFEKKLKEIKENHLKTLDKSSQMWYNIRVIKVSGN